MLEIIDLAKRYGDVVALDGATFTARPGRIVGFLGPNGAGKTTTMRCIFGLARPDRGEMRWAGRRRPRHPAALRLHARAARPVPADAGRRAAQLLRPAARLSARRPMPRPGVAGAARPRRSREVEARGAVARQPAADPARHRPCSRPRAARARRAVLGPRPARHGDHDRSRPRAGGGRGRGGVLEPRAGSRRRRLRGRRDHRARPDRRRGSDRRAPGCFGRRHLDVEVAGADGAWTAAARMSRSSSTAEAG